MRRILLVMAVAALMAMMMVAMAMPAFARGGGCTPNCPTHYITNGPNETAGVGGVGGGGYSTGGDSGGAAVALERAATTLRPLDSCDGCVKSRGLRLFSSGLP